MQKAILLFGVMLFGVMKGMPLPASAQHAHVEAEMVSGPERIEEGTAYRLLLLNLTDAVNQRERFEAIGLNETEITAAVLTLRDFRGKYDALANDYNDSEQSIADWNAFVRKRNVLIEHARQELATYLSVASAGAFHQHVLGERANMWSQETNGGIARLEQPRLVNASFPQQQCTLRPGYSVYISYSGGMSDPSGNGTFTKSSTLEGTTTVYGGCSAFHRPWVWQQFGGASQANPGGSVPMTSYINQPTSITVSGIAPGTVLGDNTQATIYCTVLQGNIFSFNRHLPYVEYATTWTHATGPGTYQGKENLYTYPVVHYCSNGTPDYNPTSIWVNEPNAATDTYFPIGGVLWRSSTTNVWSVLWSGTAIYGYSMAPTYHTCTHTGPQQ